MKRPIALVFVCLLDGMASAAERPNIVLILADDLGFSDLGCYGSEIPTPHLDRLAAHGMRFTQFYNAGRCCPTRASLLTGLYPHQAGVGHMEANLALPAYQGFLNGHCVTIAEVLRTQGYRTLMTGKWNVGHVRPQWPVDRGFERYFGLLRGASNYFDPRVGPRRNASQFALDDQPFTSFDETFFATDTFTDYAVRWIEESAGKGPFFLYTAYTAPHSPLHAHAEDIERHRGKYGEGWDVLRRRRYRRMIELGLLDADMKLPPSDPRVPAWTDVTDQDFQDLKMAVFAAQVARMDRGIGRIVEALDRTGALQNTLLMFLSDNGGDGESESATKDIPPGPKESSHIYGRPWAQLSNTPFRGYKHQTLEGGIATPLIAHWPATIKTAAITHQPGHIIDLMATCLDAAGVQYPQTHEGRTILPLEGKSLLPIFRSGQREPHAALFWEHEGHRAVRQGQWKLVALHNVPWQLYDLAADRTEVDDRASTSSDRVRELIALYDAWAARCGVVPWAEIKPR